MAHDTARRRKPPITMTRSDHERLSRLVESLTGTYAAVADQLMAELDRARVVEDRRIAPRVVRMGSRLRFTTDAGESRNVTLVYPDEADIAEGKISILTPIGAALIGLSPGQSIPWTARDGRTQRLTVESIEIGEDVPPETRPAEARPAP